jgi:hypothetical protein
MGQDYGASVFLGLSPHDFTVRKLTCLARKLRDERELGLKTFYVAFFSSHEAAKYFQPPGSPSYSTRYGQQLHATYTFDYKKGQETLDIMPTGFDSKDSLNTTIDLSHHDSFRCNLNVSSRCLMAVVQPILYPEEALGGAVSGKVSLSGIIGADGRIRGAAVAEAQVAPAGAKGNLASAALHNLESWQFDEDAGNSPIRITYTYVLDGSLPAGATLIVDWDLPNEIAVRGGGSH